MRLINAQKEMILDWSLDKTLPWEYQTISEGMHIAGIHGQKYQIMGHIEQFGLLLGTENAST